MSRRSPALGIATAAGLATAIVAASTRGSPVPAGGLELGDAASIAFIVALAVAFALYTGALVTLRRGGGRLTLVCAIAAAIQLIPLGGPLLLSHDVYSYWAYGRIVSRHDSDPYSVPPARFPSDPAARAVAPSWRETASVYGPAFTAFSIGVDRATHGSAEAVAFVFRSVAALAAIAATLLAAFIARRKVFAAAFVGWNPLLAVSSAGGGHSDILMLVLMLGALALASRQRDTAAGGLWVLAAAVKAPALFLLPLQLVNSSRRFLVGCAL